MPELPQPPVPADERSTAVIVIHGVGDFEVGSLAEPLAAAFADPARPFRRGSLLCEGVTYGMLEASGPGVPLTLFEMNWSNVMRPGRSWKGVAEHVVRLAYSMVGLAADWPGGNANWAFRCYRFAFELGMLWLPLQALAVLLIVSFPGAAGFLAGVGCAVGCGTLSRFVRPISPLARVGGLVTAGAIALLACFRPTMDASSLADVTHVSTRLYVLGDAAAALLLLGVMGAIFFCSPATSTSAQRAARMFIATLPLLLISILGSTLGLLALIPASKGRDHGVWEKQHLQSLGFDLLLAEALMAATFLGIGLIAAAIAVRCRARCRSGDPAAGRGVRDQLPLLCRAVSLALVCVALVLLADVSGVHFFRDLVRRVLIKWGLIVPGEREVLEVYTLSAVRLLSLLPLLLVPVRIGLDVVGDVIFYAAPPLTTGNVRLLLRERLLALLKHASQTHCHVVVVAHSQGSVIALETLSAVPDLNGVRLLTMGSPIRTLYQRFLNFTVSGSTTYTGPQWVNLYRDCDPIGGPIEGSANDVSIGEGGHTKYWGDAAVHAKLVAMMPQLATG